jgi:hypothetical protein
MRYLTLLSLLALVPLARGSEPPASWTADPPASVATKKSADPRESVVFVEHNNSAGTGTVVSSEGGKSLVLTCAHVVENSRGTITVTTRAGKRHAATYVAGSVVRNIGPALIDVDGPDLCVLSVDADLPAAKVADGPPAVGSPVELWGFGGQPYGAKPAHKTGLWDHPPPWTRPASAYTVRTISGDSGAGVFNAAGELVAVHHGGDGRRGYGTPLGTVRGWLREKVAKLFPRLAARLAARSLARALADAFDDPPPAAKASDVSQKPKAPPKTPTYADVYARVLKGERVTFTAPLPGFTGAPGTYRCWLRDGKPVMEPCGPEG